MNHKEEEWSRIEASSTVRKRAKRLNRDTTTKKKMSTSASTLLDVATSYKASDVLDYTAASTHNNNKKPSSVIVVDSKMTPLEAATLLWENNM